MKIAEGFGRRRGPVIYRDNGMLDRRGCENRACTTKANK